MNREQRRKQNKKPNGKDLWERLSESEKETLTKFMVKEANKELEINIKTMWDDIEKYLFQSMRNNKISVERAEKIVNDTNNLVDRVHNVKVIPDDAMDNYIVLSKDEFSDLLEYAAMNCENCAGVEGCKLYKIQHNQKAPVIDGSFKCRFSFIVPRRKSV